ncbi:PPC domain-containing DNA-binding protein [Bacillota bacterium Meth-B3]|nr:PPC domain-containing DNA-binding protein [Christensenellaceae bacterium]MEA5066292.1 PPC domain-containing DNA-binding protein [Eubacteriales bacterium]
MTDFLRINIARGEHIRERINAFALEHGIDHAYVSGAVGSASDCVFNAPDGSSFPIKPVSTPVAGPAEILAFSGEILPKAEMDDTMKRIYKDDPYELFIHVHAAVATAGAQVYGGALVNGISFRQVSVYIWPTRG